MLNEAFTIDDNEKNTGLNIDKLLTLRSQIDSCLSQWIQDLRDKSAGKEREYNHIESRGRNTPGF